MNRPTEILICLAACILSLPLFLCACGATALTLGRPLFFVQERAGLGGEPFGLIKLRTMRDSRDANGRLLPDRMRCTAVGTFLRRLRLDESPQLLLILLGKMALVGPRPLLPETIRGFGDAGRIRCSVRPGLTGWAQVSGNTRLTDGEKLQLDLWYVSHRSLALDLRILAETVAVAIGGEHRRTDRLDAAASWLETQGDPLRLGASS